MEDSWVTLQLPHSEEGVTDDVLCKSLLSILPELEVFIPVLRFKDKRGDYCYSLFDGYVFVRGPYKDGDYLRLDGSPYVYEVLSYPGTKGRIAYTPDAKIVQMREQLQAMIPSGFEVGDAVCIIDGVYKDLKGRVVGVNGDDMVVEIYMPWGSLTKLTTLPCMFLDRDDSDSE